MRRHLGHVMAAAGAAISALVFAASASAATFHGTVVHNNRHAHSFVLAGRSGRLIALHASRLPHVGRTVTVRARRLHNGTWLALRVQVGHSAKRVRLRGTVTYVNSKRHEFVLSTRGASFVIHVHTARRHDVRHTTDSPPAVGDVVTVSGQVSDETVDATQVQETTQAPSSLNLEGVVLAVDPTAGTLTISADDDAESGATVTVQIPSSFDATAFQAGQSVELTVASSPDGTLTLQQSSNDSSSRQADDPADMQGDDHGDQQSSSTTAPAPTSSSSSGSDSPQGSGNEGSGSGHDGQGSGHDGSGSGENNSNGAGSENQGSGADGSGSSSGSDESGSTPAPADAGSTSSGAGSDDSGSGGSGSGSS